ncbi:hypothetical protein E2C01_085089 [Portunus trituberculatus]|uniref:Uncharacterized protein n=1 Tax=Portunus trituberculatus TaxID=210409 RepID=A0A5B7J5U8_PORTR|nr:hypothetical protein [Portunus trituberculatus]
MGSVTWIAPFPCMLCGVRICWLCWTIKEIHATESIELCWPDGAVSNTPEVPADSSKHPSPPTHLLAPPPHNTLTRHKLTRFCYDLTIMLKKWKKDQLPMTFTVVRFIDVSNQSFGKTLSQHVLR